jgi:hypothetical protein
VEAARKKIARDRTVAMAFLKGADSRRYSSLWMDLANEQNQGHDQYLKDLTAAYSVLVNYLGPSQPRQQSTNASQPGGQNLTKTGGGSRTTYVRTI